MKNKFSVTQKNILSSIFFVLYFLFATSKLFAQFTLQIQINQLPYTHTNDTIFVAGNFNNWQPNDSAFKFFIKDGKVFAQIKNLKKAAYQFKFTRGSWQKTETDKTGLDILNRIVNLNSDSTISFTIEGWSDDFTSAKKHTASANVQILDTAFFIPQLNCKRKIWIYLPKGYAASNKKYPVLYMHDGQNLFDKFTTAFGTEWGVDEILDSLIDKEKPPCIVIGIDNGQSTRMSEYNPYKFIFTDSFTTIKPLGDEYLSFIVNTLKPFVDKHYKTLSNKENTIIAGSSMGGLISYYAALKYPDIFGKAGIFSPAFWTAPEIKNFTNLAGKKNNCKFFFYIGEQEGGTYVNDMNEVVENLGAISNAMIISITDANGQHNEQAWHKWFAEFYNWIMADGFNYVLKIQE